MECASGRTSPKFARTNGVMVSTSSVRMQDARASQARSGTNNRSGARASFLARTLRPYSVGQAEPLIRKK